MKCEPDRVHRIVRHGERLDRDIIERKLSASRKQSPVPTPLRKTAGPKRLRCESIAINRQIELVAENLKAADVIAVLMRKKNAVELFRSDAALLQAQHDLPRAETAINENLAMIGRDQRAVS